MLHFLTLFPSPILFPLFPSSILIPSILIAGIGIASLYLYSSMSQTMKLSIDFGSYKVVILNSYDKPVIRNLKTTSSTVLIISSSHELQKEQTIFNWIEPYDWTSHIKQWERVLDSCFARIAPSTQFHTISDIEMAGLYQHLMKAETKRRIPREVVFKRIMASRDLCITQMPRLQPLHSMNIIEWIVHSQNGSEVQNLEQLQATLFKGIGQFLMDIARGCFLFSENRMCHGDLKITNCLYDPRTRRFKLADFGLVSRHGSVDYTDIYSRVDSPWYHPLYKQFSKLEQDCVLGDIKRRNKSNVEIYCDAMMDRFMFVFLAYDVYIALQFYRPLADYQEILNNCQSELKRLILSFAYKLDVVSEIDFDFDDDTLAYIQEMSFVHSATRLRNYENHRNSYYATFYKWIVRNGMYCIQPWNNMFDNIVSWTFPKRAQKVAHQSLDQYIRCAYLTQNRRTRRKCTTTTTTTTTSSSSTSSSFSSHSTSISSTSILESQLKCDEKFPEKFEEVDLGLLKKRTRLIEYNVDSSNDDSDCHV